jgi:hypothetical protein
MLPQAVGRNRRYSMKKIFLATAIVLSTASIVMAQGQRGAADSSIPGATNPNTSNAPARPGTTGAPAGDSSLPGATNPNKSNAPAKNGTTGAPAGDSSIPGATNPNAGAGGRK